MKDWRRGETGGFEGSAFSFTLAPGESIRDRIVRCCHEALDPGPIGHDDRHNHYKSFLAAGNERDDASAEFLTHVRTSCALFVRAVHLWCGAPAKGPFRPGTPMYDSIGVNSPALFTSPSFVGAGTAEPRPGDTFVLVDPANWNNAHTGFFLDQNDDGSWTTAEGGGGDGTLCRFRSRTIAGKHFADDARTLWGWFDCTQIGLPASRARTDASDTGDPRPWGAARPAETGDLRSWLGELLHLDPPDDPDQPGPPAPLRSPGGQATRIRGSAFMASLPAGGDGASRALRAKAVLAAVRAGVALPIVWKRVVSRAGGHEGRFWVASDTLRFGVEGPNADPTDWDWVRVSTTATTAQQIADVLGVLMPTARLSDLAYLQADVKLEPHTQNPAATTHAMLAHQACIEAERAGRRGLAATVGKDWILAPELWPQDGPRHPLGIDGAVNYGWHTKQRPRLHGPFEWPPGALGAVVLWQQPGRRHDRWHEDYSQWVSRFVHPVCVVDGGRRATADIYVSPDLSILVSINGPMGGCRMPNVPLPNGARELRSDPPEQDAGDPGLGGLESVLGGVLGGLGDALGGTAAQSLPPSVSTVPSLGGRIHWIKAEDPSNNLDATVHGAVVQRDRIAFSASVDRHSYDVTLAPAPGNPAAWTGRWRSVDSQGEGPVDVRLYRSPDNASVALVGHWQEKGDWWWFVELRPDTSGEAGDPFASLGQALGALEGSITDSFGSKRGPPRAPRPSGGSRQPVAPPRPGASASPPQSQDERELDQLAQLDRNWKDVAGQYGEPRWDPLGPVSAPGPGYEAVDDRPPSAPGPGYGAEDDTGEPAPFAAMPRDTIVRRGNVLVFVDRKMHTIRKVAREGALPDAALLAEDPDGEEGQNGGHGAAIPPEHPRPQGTATVAVTKAAKLIMVTRDD
jgi:hypothetical protein